MFDWLCRKRNTPHALGTTRTIARRMRQTARDIMVALAVVLMVFVLAARDSRAHALEVDGASATSGILFKASYASPDASGISALRLPQMQPGAMAMPELVTPNATLGASAPALNHPDKSFTRVAAGAQIVWRHSGRSGDLLPRFAAAQNKRHAAMTGPAPFLLMALVFALMSAVTMGLWRQLRGAALNGSRTGHRSPHRLR